jgi:hypothetical protein
MLLYLFFLIFVQSDKHVSHVKEYCPFGKKVTEVDTSLEEIDKFNLGVMYQNKEAE